MEKNDSSCDAVKFTAVDLTIRKRHTCFSCGKKREERFMKPRYLNRGGFLGVNRNYGKWFCNPKCV